MAIDLTPPLFLAADFHLRPHDEKFFRMENEIYKDFRRIKNDTNYRIW
jgi:hypothetical protein